MDKQKKYEEVYAELEALVKKIEDPERDLASIGADVKKAMECIAWCRAYIRGNQETIEKLKDTVINFNRNFKPQNAFHFNTMPVTDNDYLQIAVDLQDFMDNNKIEEFRRRTSEHYKDILGRISTEIGALMKRRSDVDGVILDINRDFVEKNFDASIKELAWHLIKEQLVAANNIKVEEDDLKAVAKEAIRAQFVQYGMSNVPEDVLENYAAEQMKKRENVDNFVDRAVDVKLTEALKNVVKLNQKEVTLEEFNKLMQQK